MKKLVCIFLLVLVAITAHGDRFLRGETFGQRYDIDPTGLVLWLDQSDPRSGGSLDQGIFADLNGTSHFFRATDAAFPAAGITGATDLTIQAWIKLGNITVPNVSLVSKYDSSTSRAMYDFELNLDELRFVNSNDGSALGVRNSTNASLVVGKWIHIAVAYDASAGDCFFYKNGILLTDDGGALKVTIADKDPAFIVGSRNEGGSVTFEGGIRNVSLFNDIRTAAEILDAATDRDIDLSGEGNIIWQGLFDDGPTATVIDNNEGTAGGDLVLNGGDTTDYSTHTRITGELPFTPLSNWYDLSGNGNHASQATAASQPAITGADGLNGSARSFDGSADTMELAAGAISLALDGAAGVSVSCWFRVDTLDATTQALLSVFIKSNGGNRTGLQLAVIATTDVLRIGGRSLESETFETKSGSAVVTGQWYHAVGTLDFAGDTITLYVDGVQDGAVAVVTFTNSAWTDSATHTVTDDIGSGAGLSFFDGFMDTLQIFSRVLTAAEVQQLYLADKPRHGGL